MQAIGFFAGIAIAALSFASTQAAVFNATGTLEYDIDGVISFGAPELVLSGMLDADLEGLDPRARARYVASAKLGLPNGFEVAPFVENDAPRGPASFAPVVDVDRPITLFDGALVTPALRVGALLNTDLGAFTPRQALRAAFAFFDANPVGLRNFSGVQIGWDVRDVDVDPQTLKGEFLFGLRGAPLGLALDDFAADLGAGLVGPLLRQLDRQGDLPALCANNPARCVDALTIAGVDAFSADYELSLSFRPVAPIPLPGSLPLAATGLAALALVRRMRRRG